MQLLLRDYLDFLICRIWKSLVLESLNLWKFLLFGYSLDLSSCNSLVNEFSEITLFFKAERIRNSPLKSDRSNLVSRSAVQLNGIFYNCSLLSDWNSLCLDRFVVSLVIWLSVFYLWFFPGAVLNKIIWLLIKKSKKIK